MTRPAGPRPTLLVAPSPAEFVELAARRFVAAVGEALEARGRARVALAGGQTPRDLYALLATPAWRARVDWSRIDFFWGDERCVSPESDESNYRMARDTLLRELSLQPDQVHRIPAELDPPEDAAARAEAELSHAFQRAPGHGSLPVFDLVLLGLGADGHTASLFPNSPLLKETVRWTGVARPLGMTPRISLTLPVLNAARQIHFLVTGEAKASAARQAFLGTADPPSGCPAGLVRPPRGAVVWVIDRAAASLIEVP